MRSLRTAIVGCGLISEFHLRGWQQVPKVEVVALVDPDLMKAEARKAEFAPGAQVFDSLEKALERTPLDFVEVLSPPAFHARQCLAAKSAGLHVICQKPLCDTYDEARSLVDAFEGGEQQLCVHENHIYRPWFQLVAERHASGFFGPIRRLRFEQNDPTRPPQRLNAEAERGVLLQYGVHLIDMVRHLLGTPVRVSACTHRVNPEVRGESLALVTFEYPACTASVEVAYKNGVIGQGSALLIGDDGEAFYEGTMIRGGDARLRLSHGPNVVLDDTRSTVAEYVASFPAFQRAFIDALLNGSAPPQPARENLKTLAMTFAAYRSAGERRPVEFAEFEGA